MTVMDLKDIFLFANLASKEVDEIKRMMTVRQIEREQFLFMEGTDVLAFFVLSQGAIKIFRTSTRGDEHIIHFHHQRGDLIAEATLFEMSTYPANCQALEDGPVLQFPKAPFIAFIENNPHIALAMMAAYSRRMRQLVSTIEGLAFYDVKTRLAQYILDNLIEQNSQLVCHLLMTKKELAALLGTIPETLSRSLYYLKKRQIISEQGHLIVVNNVERLEDIVL